MKTVDRDRALVASTLAPSPERNPQLGIGAQLFDLARVLVIVAGVIGLVAYFAVTAIYLTPLRNL